MTDQLLKFEVRSLAHTEGRREAFAKFRQSMLGIGDIGRASTEAEHAYLEGGSPIGGFVDDELQGVVNGYGSSVVLPGGNRVSHLGVTHVGVSPTHARRGIARRLLTEQLRQARASGFVVAGLRASDARIYGRYGYGIASWSVRQEIDLTNGGRLNPVHRGDVRRVDALENFELFKRIANSSPVPRAATLTRWDAWWEIQKFRTTQGSTPHHAVVIGAEGAERGYLRFHVQPSENWFTSAQRTVIVDDLVAHDDVAWRGLMEHLLSQDILHKVILPSRPIDDPLQLLIDNPRAVQISELRDESWIRPLDLEKFLNGRTYGRDSRVVFQITDPILPDNTGVWSLSGKGAVRSEERPALELSIQAIAELVFGAQSAAALAAAGRIDADRLGIGALDEAFGVPGTRPHSGISF
ncbi:GNAT family N-acetyltransferase [Rhizobium cauense]|uniref:GNAT family N-acetyltransferase n=1 Tax=Rhizobium cauense TaxID=1166683 RepID=UPI001C6F2B8F|nr:GNAT family N-acetyltransferase [Rhizobium cauense]MBW9116811.1 GNAT family N-acetyltransferase [Rhizobium cauense]